MGNHIALSRDMIYDYQTHFFSFPVILQRGKMKIWEAKVDDLKKVVYRFVPREFWGFHDTNLTSRLSRLNDESLWWCTFS